MDDECVFLMFVNQVVIVFENVWLYCQVFEKECFECEMEFVVEIQCGLFLQGLLRVQDLEVVGWNWLMQQVGGDYYGFIMFDEGCFGFVVVDVMGKGMFVVLFVLMLYLVFKLFFDKVDLGVDLLEWFNMYVVDLSSFNKFIILIMVIVDLQNDWFGFFNVGYNLGFWVMVVGEVEELQLSGFLLGFFFGSMY